MNTTRKRYWLHTLKLKNVYKSEMAGSMTDSKGAIAYNLDRIRISKITCITSLGFLN